ncbi:MAG: serine/threonine protein phosphatase [Myxococcales bacterium]|nr:serine/threonine protein phosphatase [Myxococcales bacterium]
MPGRTFAIGDIHGDIFAVYRLLAKFPELDETDTIVFLGDYVDRGPHSARVVDYVRNLAGQTKAKVVALRGNHEDAWLRVVDRGWDGFVTPPINGCLAAYRSFIGGPVPQEHEEPRDDERLMLLTGGFYPDEVLAWFRSLPYWYEDQHAIFVHAGLPKKEGQWVHPSAVDDPTVLLWIRDEDFFINYRGKTVVFGHTTTSCLPPEYSSFTPDDPDDLWAGTNVIGIDTGAGKGGFLTAIQFPEMHVYESR